jgi:hypothetical protein
MNVCVMCCHGNTVKGFWALWDNVHMTVFNTIDFAVIVDGQVSN